MVMGRRPVRRYVLQVEEKVILPACCELHPMVKAKVMANLTQRAKGKEKGGNPIGYNGSLKFPIMDNDGLFACVSRQASVH